ncbi:MAG: hypothetical protein AAF975_03700 [Spirochaetota bacterium]
MKTNIMSGPEGEDDGWSKLYPVAEMPDFVTHLEKLIAELEAKGYQPFPEE